MHQYHYPPCNNHTLKVTLIIGIFPTQHCLRISVIKGNIQVNLLIDFRRTQNKNYRELNTKRGKLCVSYSSVYFDFGMYITSNFMNFGKSV